MSEYMTKEEVMQWRRSTEKCTLEEYAMKLGKKLETEKETHDMVDIVNNGEAVVQVYQLSEEEKSLKVFIRPKQEKQIKPIKETVKKEEAPIKVPVKKEVEKEQVELPVQEEVVTVPDKVVDKPIIAKAEEVKPEKIVSQEVSEKEVLKVNDDEFITLKKPLTEREQKVFEFFKENKGKIVFAKDIAELLNLKRDYIYKYIKNLRTKIVENVLVNSDEGGFIFK